MTAACGTLDRLRNDDQQPLTVYLARPLPSSCYVRPVEPREVQTPRLLPEDGRQEEVVRNERANLINALSYWQERFEVADEALDVNADQMNTCIDGLPPQEPVG